MRSIYTLLLYLLTPAVLLRLWWKGRRVPAYRRRWKERFGYAGFPARDDSIWIHAVSVGETVAAQPLVEALLQRNPKRDIVFTTTTPTGSERARALFGNKVAHGYMPYDLPGAVNRFLRHCRPAQLIVMETELWPNLYQACHALGVRIIIANARLSSRSAERYARFPTLVRDTLQKADLIAAQSRADARRFLGLGAAPGQVHVTGSLKFELRLPPGIQPQGEALRRELGPDRPVLLAASTHAGEEDLVLDAFARLLHSLPDALLMLAPRHPERFDAVADLCRRRGLRLSRRSRSQACKRETQVYLGDSMGELLLLYAASDLAFIGGSLVEQGGHNPLEAAALGLPVVFGPHMFNFQDISRLLLEKEAAIQVDDAEALAAVCERWLRDANLRHDTGQRGQQVVQDNKGALERLLGLLSTRQ